MAKSAVKASRETADARSATHTAGSSWYTSAIEGAMAARAGWRSKALGLLTSEAGAAWAKVLFPTPRVEAWKYTNVEDVAGGSFGIPADDVAVTAAQLAPAMLPVVTPHVAVVVNGLFRRDLSSLSLSEGISVSSFAEISSGAEDARFEKLGFSGAHRDQPFAALATALLRDGLVISVAKGAVIETPLHVLNVVTAAAEGAACAPRLLIDADAGSQVTIVQSYVSIGANRYLNLPVTEIFAAESAVVDNYVYQNESPASYHVATSITRQERSSWASTHIFSFGGRLVRNNVEALLHGSGSNAVLNGLTVLSEEQHADNATLIHHVEPHIESREHFKGIYAHRSKGVFTGTITVESEAQKTNAFQSNQSLLLSSEASIETRPQLKIWADDVKCTHGATVGQLDDEALFYLRSRGLDKETARNFLVHAFASEVLTAVKVEALKQHVEEVLSAKLESLES